MSSTGGATRCTSGTPRLHPALPIPIVQAAQRALVSATACKLGASTPGSFADVSQNKRDAGASVRIYVNRKELGDFWSRARQQRGATWRRKNEPDSSHPQQTAQTVPAASGSLLDGYIYKATLDAALELFKDDDKLTERVLTGLLHRLRAWYRN
jgi:hypothetical protein